jgi:hypothetical protein
VVQKKLSIADFQTEFHGESEKKLSFSPQGFEKWPIRLLEKTAFLKFKYKIEVFLISHRLLKAAHGTVC